MNKHISKRFDQDLKKLQQMMILMGELAEKQFSIIHEYLRKNLAADTLAEVSTLEEQINQFHLNINAECVRLTATRAPVAIDLRFLSAVVRVSIDFERVGDELCKIARFLMQENIDVNGQLWQTLRPTARLAHQMLSEVLEMLKEINLQAAVKLLGEDRELNSNYVSVTRQLITYMMEDARTIGQAVDVLFTAKAFERVGDHCMNIAEAMIFYEKAEDVRHKSQEEIEKWRENYL